MAQVYARGENFDIHIDGTVALCRVVQRPDLSMEAGAECAKQMSKHFAHLAEELGLRGIVFDLREGPPVFGPKTEAAIAEMLGHFEAAKRPVACLVGPNPVQRMQYSRMVEIAAKRHGRVEFTFRAAVAHVSPREQLSEPPPLSFEPSAK